MKQLWTPLHILHTPVDRSSDTPLPAPQWSAVPSVPVVVAETKQVLLPANQGHRFYRLYKP